MNRVVVLLSLAVLLFSIACNEEKTLEDSLNEQENSAAEVKKAVDISEEVFKDIIKGIPSPLEISALIKESGVPYEESMLNSADNLENYSTNYSRALNLGILGADLGYINMYEKTTTSIGYLQAIKSLADDLKVGQFFDFSTIKRLATNSSNIDSLLNITTTGFEEMNHYLVEQKRGDVGVLILVGGWLEALHIAIEVAKRNDNPELFERVGEQKITLNEIKLLVEVYQDNPSIGQLADDFSNLKAAFDEVTISYVYEEPEMMEVDGVLMVVDKSSSKIEMTSQQFENIDQIVQQIRSKII